jgi:hypothetical protein
MIHPWRFFLAGAVVGAVGVWWFLDKELTRPAMPSNAYGRLLENSIQLALHSSTSVRTY